MMMVIAMVIRDDDDDDDEFITMNYADGVSSGDNGADSDDDSDSEDTANDDHENVDLIGDDGHDCDTDGDLYLLVLLLLLFFLCLFREPTLLVARKLVPLAQQARHVQTLIPMTASLVYQDSIQWDHKLYVTTLFFFSFCLKQNFS